MAGYAENPGWTKGQQGIVDAVLAGHIGSNGGISEADRTREEATYDEYVAKLGEAKSLQVDFEREFHGKAGTKEVLQTINSLARGKGVVEPCCQVAFRLDRTAKAQGNSNDSGNQPYEDSQTSRNLFVNGYMLRNIQNGSRLVVGLEWRDPFTFSDGSFPLFSQLSQLPDRQYEWWQKLNDLSCKSCAKKSEDPDHPVVYTTLKVLYENCDFYLSGGMDVVCPLPRIRRSGLGLEKDRHRDEEKISFGYDLSRYCADLHKLVSDKRLMAETKARLERLNWTMMTRYSR